MIYPTRLAVMVAVAGAPFALAIAALSPERWAWSLLWPIAVLVLCAYDAMRSSGRAALALTIPQQAGIGESWDAAIDVRLRAASPPRHAQVALAQPAILALDDHGLTDVELSGGEAVVNLSASARRRGEALVDRAWLRWAGPLGLTWRQQEFELDERIAVVPDTRPLRDRGAEVYRRHSYLGLMSQRQRGEGSDFDALAEYRPGMDRRSIDWNQSARHVKLLAKQYHSERNNQVVFVVDCGRQMSEPVAGMPRVDRAVGAMLMTAWIALKSGDRVSFQAFDSRPRLASGIVAGSRAFGELKRLSARIDYSDQESNYVFALTTMAARLNRRSMIVLFTEFTDQVSADFLVRAVKGLVAKHLVLVVVLRDEELEELEGREPEEADDVTRAITATALLKERALTVGRLRHLGVHVIESHHERVADELAAGYFDLKRRNLL